MTSEKNYFSKDRRDSILKLFKRIQNNEVGKIEGMK